jgi:pimeloyl-ACP methyl ester carboxylesterase
LYSALLEAITPRIREAGRVILLAESFSGHLAVRFSERFQESVAALVLCNSFVAPPRSPLLRALPWSLLFAVSPPSFVVRHFFVGRDASSELVQSVRVATRETSVGVMAARLASVLSEDSRSSLERVTRPILYLRGSEDRLVPASSSEAVLRAASNPVRVTIPGPHLLLQRYPRESWGEITRFLAEAS